MTSQEDQFLQAAKKNNLSYIKEHLGEMGLPVRQLAFVYTPVVDVAKYLLAHGRIEINAYVQGIDTNTKFTALYHACQTDNMLKVSWLLQAGANVNLPVIVVEGGVEINAESPLMNVAQRRNFGLSIALLEAGADVNYQDAQGRTIQNVAKYTIEWLQSHEQKHVNETFLQVNKKEATLKIKRNMFLQSLDPYKQSFIYFKTKPLHWLILGAACVIMFLIRHSLLGLCLLCNPLFAYPNVYIHSLFGHFLLGQFLYSAADKIFDILLSWEKAEFIRQLLYAASGSLGELLFPLAGIIVCLRIYGGRYVLPVMLYWLSVSLFSTGTYMLDPVRQVQTDILPLSSTNILPLSSSVGDWGFIFNILGLTAYQNLIGNAVIILSIICFVVAVWSPFYYWLHMDQYPLHLKR